jgi:predicted SprT family Zn-dependent metalloprotease
MLAEPVQLTITDNTRSLITVKTGAGGYTVRLHHMFLDADDEVLRALTQYIRSRNTRTPAVLKQFVRANEDKIRKTPPRPRRTVLRPVGRCYDLRALFDEVNHEYFDGKLHCAITWGANRRVRRRKSVRLGAYSEETRTIHINPVLDSTSVPRFVVKGIIYHEMLHHSLGAARANGRRIAHSRAFRELESRFRHYDRVHAWVESNRRRLLGAR